MTGKLKKVCFRLSDPQKLDIKISQASVIFDEA